MSEVKAPSGYKIEQVMATWMAVRARLLDDDPSLENDEAALTRLLGPVEGSVDDVLTRVLRGAVHAELMAKAADEQAKTIAARKKRYEARKESLRGVAFAILDTIGKRHFELPDLTASISTGHQGVSISDETKIPDKFVEIKTVRTPDKAVILSTLKSGEEVEGCSLANGLDYLTIRKG